MSHISTIMEHRPPDNANLRNLLSSTDGDLATATAAPASTFSTDAPQPSSTPRDAAQLLTLLKSGTVASPSHLMTMVSSPLPKRRHSLSSNPDIFENENRSPDPLLFGSQYSNTIESRNFSPSTGTKRQQVKNACTNCQKACKKCDDQRPCSRCVKYQLENSCTNSARKERKKGIKRGPYKRKYDEADSPPNRSITLSSIGSPRDPYHSYFRSTFDDPSLRMQQPLLPNLSRQTTEPARYHYDPQARFSPTMAHFPSRYAAPSYSSSHTRSPSTYKSPYSHLVETKSNLYRASTTSPMSSAPSTLPSLSELRYPDSLPQSLSLLSSSSSPSPSSPSSSPATSYGWYTRPSLMATTGAAASSSPSASYEAQARSQHGSPGIPSSFFSTHSSSPQNASYDAPSHHSWSPGSHFRSGSNTSSTGHYSPSAFSKPQSSIYGGASSHGLGGYHMMSSEEEGSRRHSRNASSLYTRPSASSPHLLAPGSAKTAMHHGSSRRSSSLLKLPPLVNTMGGKFPWEQRDNSIESRSEQDVLSFSPPISREPSHDVPSIESYMKTSATSKLAALLSDDSSMPGESAPSRGLDELSEICSVEIGHSGDVRSSPSSAPNRKASAA